MAEQFVAKSPDFKGSGIDIWKATDKNGNLYLKVKVLDGKAIACFKFQPKAKTAPKQEL